MNRTEISQQLAEIKIEVITSKTKFKKISENAEWGEFIGNEKDQSKDLVQTFSTIIDQLTILEKNISSRRFFKRWQWLKLTK